MNQITSIFTTVEIAEMMDMKHYQILEKLEGTKKVKGIIPTLSNHEIMVAKYFVESSYIDAQGKPRKCYEVTKLGCDFLANKFTGEKGMLFTAKYVERFNEMEQSISAKEYPVKATSLGEVASYTKEMDKVMREQGSKAYKIAEAFKMVSEQMGIALPSDFVNVPEYEQMQLTLTK